MEQLCRLFELLGIFIAKCIQDKRRVDLPLARPFFKLMTTSAARVSCVEEECGAGEPEEEGKSDQGEGTQLRNNEQLTEDERNDSSQLVSNRQQQQHPRQSRGSLQQPGSRGNQNVDRTTDEGAATSSKEAELQMLVAGEEDEITKDCGGEKEELVLEELGEGGGGGGMPETEASWFEGILQLEDLEEVNPYR